MGDWKLDDISWSRFDRTKVDPDILCVVKAASLVEFNGGDYARYLCGVFADDPEFQEAARHWGTEEIQHGRALGRWAELADPEFRHADASARFSASFRVDLDARHSIRGTRTGELVSRCIVETGTSSFYTALGEAVAEPVLVQICRHIAADELRHYKLFYRHLQRYLARERIGVWGRFKAAAGRIAETDDDELAYAYHAANEGSEPYDRRRCSDEYARRVCRVYRAHHVERIAAMFLKAVGVKPNGRIGRAAARIAWWGMQRRAARLERAAA